MPKRKIKSQKEMAEKWELYKFECNNKMVLTHDFSAKNSEFVSKELRRSVTYTIEGFCVFLGISRNIFYETYTKDPAYCDIVTRIREECENDAREKFELSVIPPQLAALWMSKYGYRVNKDEPNSSNSSAEAALKFVADVINNINTPAPARNLNDLEGSEIEQP
ncbi:MAG: hypothetical protein LBB94_05455 [Clostridiales bacterium]|nr:hypothetical protein [Clostridiales bacterium]